MERRRLGDRPILSTNKDFAEIQAGYKNLRKLVTEDEFKAIEAQGWRAIPEAYDAKEAEYDACGAPLSERAPKYFWDLKQFPHANYAIDVDWGSLEEQLARWSKSHSLNLDPDFQRAHVWTVDQQSAYVGYQLQGGEVGKNIIFNCPSWDTTADGSMEIVDGKQRMEAVRKFMRNELPVFGRTLSQWSGRLRYMAGFKFHVVALHTRAELLQLYLNINAGGTPHTDIELNRVRAMLAKEMGTK